MKTPRSRPLKIAALVLGLMMILGLFCVAIPPAEALTFLGTLSLCGLGFVNCGVREFTDFFDRAQAFTTTPGFNGWTAKDVSSAGTPTYLCATEDGGKASLTLDNTSEEQYVTLYQNDVLMLDLRKLQWFEIVAKVSGIDAVTTLVMGLASAQNATEDSIAYNAFFRMEGSASTTAVVVETDDATTDLDDKATGQTLAAVYKTFRIDFSNGLADVRFYIEGERVAAGTTFDMSAAASGQNVQPFVQIHKASGTGIPAVDIAKIAYQYKYSYGA